MHKLVKNPYVDALVKALLISAIVHFIFLLAYAFMHQDASVLHFFSIIGIDRFFPEITTEPWTIEAATLMFILLYVWIFYKDSNLKAHYRNKK
jgi:hypothetical protein